MINESLRKRLEKINTRLTAVEQELANPEVTKNIKKFHVVLGMYHDQVLPVVKALDFTKTVNITLGLDFIRTSPDHGTAYDIAGKNIANAESLIAAINTAETMSNTSLKFADAANKF